MFDNDFIALLPEIFLITATIILLIFGVIYSALGAANSTFYRANKSTMFHHVEPSALVDCCRASPTGPKARRAIWLLLLQYGYIFPRTARAGRSETGRRGEEAGVPVEPLPTAPGSTSISRDIEPWTRPGKGAKRLTGTGAVGPAQGEARREPPKAPPISGPRRATRGASPLYRQGIRRPNVHHRPIVHNVAWLGFLSIFITIIVASTGPCSTANLCYNNFIIDNFTYYFKVGLLISTACIILMSLQYFQQSMLRQARDAPFESIILILLSTCSMLFMISAFDLIAMYLAIELQSLCFYVLAASKRNSEFSTEAGLKYFILGAFSSGILLFGCSLIYGFTGVTNLEELAKIFTTPLRPSAPSVQGLTLGTSGAASAGGAQSVALGSLLASDSSQLSTTTSLLFLNGSSQTVSSSIQGAGPSSLAAMGILFLAVGFLFKITAVPFHMWAPDVYEGSPTIVTAFFSVAPKIAILANMLRVFMYSFYDPMWQQLFVFCSVASMILGAFAALSQNKVKRLLAFSSIGHIGYLLIGFSCGTIEGIQSLLIGLFIYVFMTINIFTVILALRQNSHLYSNAFARFKYISDLGALAKTNPILAITISITMFSLAGIPPLAGFCSKFYLFFAALGCGAYLLALIGIITSVISCFYYIRLIKIMYFDTPKTWILYKPMDREKSILLGITIFFITFFFLYPSPLFLVTHKMALSLCL